MRNAVLVGVVLLSLCACDKIKSTAEGSAGSLFGTDFEGEIAMNLTHKQAQARGAGPTSMVFGIKKPKYRIDTSGNAGSDNPFLGQGATVLLEPAQKKGFLLIPTTKQAVILDFEKMKNMNGIPGMKPKAANQPPPKIDKTGKKDTVAGYSCEIWKITQNDGKTADACVAEGITWIDLGDIGWSSPEITVGAVASEVNRFPLRVITFDLKGQEETRLEATKIEKKKLDDARFVVPADYKQVELAQLMLGIPGLGGGALPKGLPPGFPTTLPSGFPIVK